MFQRPTSGHLSLQQKGGKLRFINIMSQQLKLRNVLVAIETRYQDELKTTEKTVMFFAE
jgi:hypothetical protein